MRNRQQTRQRAGMGMGGSEFCECTKCGYKTVHQRGMPCTQMTCPKCGAHLAGEVCK